MAVPADEVRGQLDRLLASEAFTASARLSRFLRYVVERTLAGEGDSLKEYTVGVDVFDRQDRYDPRLDSLVRVEAGRLRAKLAEYYAGAGATDPVIIRVPRGSYAAEFEGRASAPPTAAPARPIPTRRLAGLAIGVALLVAGLAAWRFVPRNDGPARPVIAVLPFAQYSGAPGDVALAARLTDGVTAELARTGALDVVSHTSALQLGGARTPLRDIARTSGATIVLEATLLREGDRVRVQARLVDATRDRKVWVEDFVGNAADARELQQHMAASVVSAALMPRRR